MSVEIISKSSDEVTFQITIKLLEKDFMKMEERILEVSNELGCQATAEALKKHDTQGEPIVAKGVRHTARCLTEKKYQTPWGVVNINRYVYQTSEGGRIYCPLEESARIIHGSTPRFARMLSHKYASMNAGATKADMEMNHGRSLNRSFLQNVAESVSAIAQLTEEDAHYSVPTLSEPVSTVTMSMDGAMLNMGNEGWREAMVGNISLYDDKGERLHSIYFGASPEHGKAAFKQRFEREATRIKTLYPNATTIGIADGANDNWPLLEKYTAHQLLDFYHAAEYLAEAAQAVGARHTGKPERSRWLDEWCHVLRHEEGGATRVLAQLETLGRKHKLSSKIKASVTDAIRYFRNHIPLMNYAFHESQNWPVGSGVTEAACKTLIKQRFCQAGMRWKTPGIKTVLSLRSLVLTKDRWGQFWDKVMENNIGAVPSC